MSKRFRTSYPIRFLTWIVFSVFVFVFRIKKKIPRDVQTLKSPYLLLGNHVGYWDPFVVGHMLPRFTHFVASDVAFSRKIPRFFLPRLGTIPKRKNVRDTQVIRDIRYVIEQGENVGLFPEAVRNWSGTTQPMDTSIAKLIKFLNVPVVASVTRGMNLFNPRWSSKLRRTKVEVKYQLLLSTEEINELSMPEIFQRVTEALQYDEVDFQKEHRQVIHSNHRAEWISCALFVCPECKSIDSYNCGGNDFTCSSCDYSLHINSVGFYRLISGKKLHYDNIRDWFDWQEKWLLDFIDQRVEQKHTEVIFQDLGSLVYQSGGDFKFKYLGKADIRLFIDRIEIGFIEDGKMRSLYFEDMQAINPQVDEQVEINYNDQMFRLVGKYPGVSGLKWELAANAIWKRMGQSQKLSAYIRHYS